MTMTVRNNNKSPRNDNARGGGGEAETPPVTTETAPPPPSSSSPTTLPPPSMMFAFLVYCALPLLLLGLAGVGPSGQPPGPAPPPYGTKGGGGGVQVNIDMEAIARAEQGGKQNKKSDGFREEVDAMLAKRGKQNKQFQQDTSSRKEGEPTKESSEADKLGVKDKFDQYIDKLRKEHKSDPTDVYKALNLADTLRQRDLTYHDGGTAQMEAIETYGSALVLVLDKKLKQVEAGEPTDVPLSGHTESMNEELFLETTAKSTDGLLCAIYCSIAKMYFMANMFEKAVEFYDQALELAPDYLDALTYQASTLIILGKYEEAARNYVRVLDLDTNRLFVDVYTGLAKVLVAQEESVPGGWDSLVSVLEEEIPRKEAMLAALPSEGVRGQSGETSRAVVVDSLKRMHLAMFAYHDTKTKDTARAWSHLSAGYRFKMSVLAPWKGEHETKRVELVKQVFHGNFWPPNVGSSSLVPIFIIGFVRSGSTLLERVLDAHPLIVGTGEDSVFNGRLDHIRNKIVEASMSGVESQIQSTVQTLADGVVRDMRARWRVIESNTSKDGSEEEGGEGSKDRPEPQRFADKMLTNYMNVGFIHMLFPNALILHVARDPMDTVFSAYKHDFPPGTLDYTSDFPSLAELYHSYRDVMEHWDNVLPGRVTHIRYEDMVNDMPGVARAIIDATGLPWDPDVLQFHKKKHAVNTLSTTQVRKGVYRDHLKSWMRYEEQLQPLAKLLGKRVDYDLKTTLPGYKPSKADDVGLPASSE